MDAQVQLIESMLPALGHTSTCEAAALAIDRAHTRIWEAASDGSVGALTAGARARNILYKGDAVGLLAGGLSDYAALKGEPVARHVLSLLDTLCKPLNPEVDAILQQALGREHLISYDFSQLNAMRCLPGFVAYALDAFVDTPDSQQPHVSATYILNLSTMDGTDCTTKSALQDLLRVRRSRDAIWRALKGRDPHKLLMVLQLLKRCLGGKAGMWSGFQTFDDEDDPPYDLAELLRLDAEAPLVAACKCVTELTRASMGTDELLTRLRMTLLDVFDLMTGSSSSSRGGISSGGISSGGSGSGRSSRGAAGGWPDALLQAHVALVVEVRTHLGSGHRHGGR